MTPQLTVPYPAALTVTGSAWHSNLARNGRVALAKPTISIGRMEDNDIVLSDPLVSRHHAMVRWSPSGGYEVVDLGAANGVLLQGQHIPGVAPLAPGQVLRIGNTDIAFNPLQPEELSAMSAENAVRSEPPANPNAEMATVRVPSGAIPQPPVMPQMAPGMQGTPMRASGAQGMTGGAPMAPGAMAMPYPYPYPMPAGNAFSQWLQRLLKKWWWRIFLIGLGGLIVAEVAQGLTGNLNFVPMILVLASALVPVTFVVYCWEQNALADIPLSTVGLAFLGGATVGLIIAGVTEAILLPSGGGGLTFPEAVIVGLCEETAKGLVVFYFLRDKRIRTELDGLILGAAAGMGFATLETAGYGFNGFIGGFITSLQTQLQNSQGNASILLALNSGISQMNSELFLRMALAAFGHGVWTAIIGAALFRYRQRPITENLANVAVAFGISVILHALWDGVPILGILFDIVVGPLFLRFFIWESLERAKLGLYAPPPAPLWVAIPNAFMGFFNQLSQRFGGSRQPAYAYAGYGMPMPVGGMYPPMQPIQPMQPMSGPQMGQMGMPPIQPMPPMQPMGQMPGPQPPRVCQNCGTPNHPEAMTCSRCGAPLR